MFDHDVAYRIRIVRDKVRAGYSVAESLDLAFGPFDHQQQGSLWNAVTLWLDPAIKSDADDPAGYRAGVTLFLVEEAYARSVRAARV